MYRPSLLVHDYIILSASPSLLANFFPLTPTLSAAPEVVECFKITFPCRNCTCDSDSMEQEQESEHESEQESEPAIKWATQSVWLILSNYLGDLCVGSHFLFAYFNGSQFIANKFVAKKFRARPGRAGPSSKFLFGQVINFQHMCGPQRVDADLFPSRCSFLFYFLFFWLRLKIFGEREREAQKLQLNSICAALPANDRQPKCHFKRQPKIVAPRPRTQKPTKSRSRSRTRCRLHCSRIISGAALLAR